MTILNNATVKSDMYVRLCVYSYEDTSSSNDEINCNAKLAFNSPSPNYTEQTFAQTVMPVGSFVMTKIVHGGYKQTATQALTRLCPFAIFFCTLTGTFSF